MSTRMVVLRVDNRPAEDESYVIGAVWLLAGQTLGELEVAAGRLYEKIHQEFDEPEDQYLLDALAQEGYLLAPPPDEIRLP